MHSTLEQEHRHWKFIILTASDKTVQHFYQPPNWKLVIIVNTICGKRYRYISNTWQAYRRSNAYHWNSWMDL